MKSRVGQSAAMFLAVVLMRSHPAEAEAPSAEHLAPSQDDIPSHLTLHEGARLLEGAPVEGLQMSKGAYAQWSPSQTPTIDAGTLSLWVKPLWGAADRQSHPFVTFKWSGSDQSYFALSQGWWEPQGARKLYVVLSNQQTVFCFMPMTFDYTLYLPDRWTLLAVTWQSGNPGYVRLFVDGKAICERKIAFTGGRHALDPIYLGSDRGAALESPARASDMVIKDVVTSPRALSIDEIRNAYVRGGGEERPKWILALIPAEGGRNPAHERRVMFDEDTRWASSKLEMQYRIRRIKAAGFNVYVPCVWDGAHAFFSSSKGPVSPTARDPANPNYDSLAYLIALAHREGIAVHPWFVIAGRPRGGTWPASYVDGAPEGAFNVHSADFRDFIVDLVLDAAARYDVDGINLDYVRAIGPCSSKACLDDYFARYRRDLMQDWKSQEEGATIPSLIEWNRGAVTDIVGRISAGTRKARPNAVLSIDTVPFDHSRQHQGLDEEGWLRKGLIDALADMTYEDPIDIDTVDRAMKAFTADRQVVIVRDYDLYGAELAERSGKVMSDYIRLIRNRWPGAGIGFYQYVFMSPEQALWLGRDVFKQAATPAWVH